MLSTARKNETEGFTLFYLRYVLEISVGIALRFTFSTSYDTFMQNRGKSNNKTHENRDDSEGRSNTYIITLALGSLERVTAVQNTDRQI